MLSKIRGWLRAVFEYVDELSLIVIGLVLFVVASNTQTGWVYLLSGTIFGALITGWLSSRRALRPAGFSLWVPAVAQRGQGFWATLSWRHCSVGYPTFWFPWPNHGLSLDQQGHNQALLDPVEREVRVWLVAERRGVYAELSSRLVCYGPLAWFAARRSVQPQLSQPLCVLPHRLQLGSQQLSTWAGGQLGGNRGRPSGQGDLRRLRDYQVGDDVRWIHWASSAHTGELVVREFSQGGSLDLLLAWGCAPAAVAQAGTEAAFEWMLSWVYTYFQGARELGWRVHLLSAKEDGQWVESEDPCRLAAARPFACPSPPPGLPEGRQLRVDFWLGDSPASPAQVYEFHPEDFARPKDLRGAGASPETPRSNDLRGAGASPETPRRRVFPGQEPCR